MDNDQEKRARPELIGGFRRVVVKVGSGVLTTAGQGLNLSIIEGLVEQMAALQASRVELLLVSSGAVASGLQRLDLKEVPKSIPQKQAAAAIGQSHLIWIYEKLFGQRGQKVAQILLTHEDLANRARYLNARNTLLTLLHYRVIPIINENDTVAVEEIKFGDNDTLSALVATMMEADLLIILSDVDGLFDGDPRGNIQARLIPTVAGITAEIEAMAGKSRSRTGIGGMVTKLQAAKKAGALGIMTVIANGKTPLVLSRILEGEQVGTLFLPQKDRLASRKHWIAYTLKPHGQLVVDDGARRALMANGKSLLPKGVVEVRGRFGPGDAVVCYDFQGREFARGLTNYGSRELQAIKGHHTAEIEDILGYRYFDEVIHRDDLVLYPFGEL
ncbi:MAG: glutamate 5-kinase [Nitrospinae bacterium]|nr:glutamate 5-kinase [Nitrospinota bacterium]